jgi:hypothetical protein
MNAIEKALIIRCGATFGILLLFLLAYLLWRSKKITVSANGNTACIHRPRLANIVREELLQLAWRSTPINMARHLTAQLPNPRAHVQKAAHHALLSRRFVDAATGRRPRQIICMPPQHGKSWHTSWWGPVWFFDWFPDKTIILASYATQFASSWGRRVRDTIELYQDQLRVRIREDLTGVSEWETTEGGGMITAGVGAGIAGRAASGLLIIDDPHKDAQEAQSPIFRQRAWDWWQSVAESRLGPDAAVLVVTTRWHEDDLAGRLLQTPDSGDWELVMLPALAEENDPLGREIGDALWPERYSKEFLERRKRNMHAFWWDTIYQQVPPEQGEGAAYTSFASPRNVRGGWELESALPVQLRVDFNRNPGMHGVVGQFARNSPRFRSRYVLHEPRMNIEQMVDAYDRLLSARFGKDRAKWPMTEVFGDATGRISQMGDGRTYWTVLANRLSHCGIKHRLRLKKSNPGKIDRVNAVNEALQTPEGDTEYLIHPECAILIRDYKEQKWDGKDFDESDSTIGHAASADGYAIEYLMPAQSPRKPTGPLRAGTA